MRPTAMIAFLCVVFVLACIAAAVWMLVRQIGGMD